MEHITIYKEAQIEKVRLAAQAAAQDAAGGVSSPDAFRRLAAQAAAQVLARLCDAVQPGMTTLDLDNLAECFIRETGGNMFTMTMHVNDDAETGTYQVGVYYMPENTVNGYYDEVSLDNARVRIESSASIRLDTLEINLGRSSWAYEGTEIKPPVVIEGLKEGEDYTVSYESNVNAGTAKAVIAGKGDYTGTVEKEFTITPVSIANAEIEDIPDQICREDGAEPEIKAMFNGRQLKQGEDYTVSYENNGSEGTATAVIKGTGNFSGTEKRSFRIISADQRKDADVTGSIYLRGVEEKPAKHIKSQA